MKVLGLVLEINPLHNGHVYFIKKAIETVKPDYTICVISTNFTSRGEISCINKFDKTKYLLQLGIDLVLENPFTGYNCSADYFAYNSIKILNEFLVTDICFGVELFDIDKLMKLEELSASNIFNIKLKYYLDKGFSYSTSCNKTMEELTDDTNLISEFSKPNNTLAIQYIRSIKKINNNIRIHLIQRINNNYYDENTNGNISSATSIRNKLMLNNNVSEFIPFPMNFINITNAYNNLFNIFKYKVITNNLLYLGIKEGFEKRLANLCLNNYDSFMDYIKTLETKRYKENYIKRVIMNILLEVSNDFPQVVNYLRPLGFNQKGKKLINKLDKETKKRIITSPKLQDSRYLDIELKATKLYGLITNNPELYLEEYKIPIKYDENI